MPGKKTKNTKKKSAAKKTIKSAKKTASRKSSSGKVKTTKKIKKSTKTADKNKPKKTKLPKTKVSKSKKNSQTKKIPKKKTARRQTKERSKKLKSVAKKVTNKLKITDDLDLKIFEEADETAKSTNVSDSHIKMGEQSFDEKDDLSLEKELSLVKIAVKKNNLSQQVPSQNILDLKGVFKSQSENQDKTLLVEELEEDAGRIFTDIFSGNISENKIYFKRAKFYTQVLNLSVVSWIIYIAFAFYKFLYPVLAFAGRAFLFAGRAFLENLKAVYNFIRLALHSFAGKVKFSKENFLYPERAFVNLSLFDHQEEYRFGRESFLTFSPVTVKSMALFLIIAFAVVLPIKGFALWNGLKSEQARVLGASETAYSSLQMAMEDIEAFSWLSASDHFAVSRDQFENLQSEFQQNHSFLKKFLAFVPSVRQKVITAENMVNIGTDISLLGEELSRLLHLLQSSNNPVTLTQKISAIKDSISKINGIEHRLNQSFSQVTISALPDDIQDDVQLLKDSLPQLFSSLHQIDELLDFTYQVLGGDKQQRYLLIFQNSDELRPAGGFMGSLSIIDVYQGKIIQSRTPSGGPYDWQGWLKEKTLAPKPLWIVNPVWQFQDANWFFDFPTSAEKILQFYHQTEPEIVDGVIAINSYVLPKILELTGDIDMPEYGKVLTSDNVLLEIQKAVELEYDPEENQPKKIIGDLFKILQEKLAQLDSKKFIALLEIINESLQEKDIQMYFINPEIQAKAANWNWSGEVRDVKGDYLAIVNTNIAGAKTDKFILQQAELNSDIQPDGEIINTLRIKRTNDGIPGDVFYGHNNVDYLRIYVPEGSQLLTAEGDFESPPEEFFEIPEEEIPADEMLMKVETDARYADNGIRITNEFDKTVFAGWLQTNIGETSEIVFKYKLPFKVTEIQLNSENGFVNNFNKFLQILGVDSDNKDRFWHSFYWQKQSGQHNNQAKYILNYPKNWQVDYLTRPGFSEVGKIEYEMPLERDFSTGFLLSE